jgi:signal transduction histidine kinase
MRRHFVRRMWFALLVLFGVVFVASGLAVALLSGALGLGDDRGLVLPAAIVALVLVVAAGGVVARMVRRLAGPVGDVMEAADRVAAGDYTVRVTERGPGDVRRLARAFNAMTSRLEANERQRRSLLADIAHELRTPLSVIQGNVEGVLDELYPADRAHLEPVLEETRVMARLLDDLRTLSTAESGALRLDRRLSSPGDLVRDAVAAFAPRAGAESVTLTADLRTGLPTVDVDPVRIGEVLSNLLHNALRHTPRGGSVTVAAATLDGGDAVEFTVEDSGPGIPDDVLPHVFDRFVKTADTGGAGLGLAIARGLVEAHGGHISVANRDGGGTVIRFRLPAGS